MRILVTGSQGFIGRNLMKSLKRQAVGFDISYYSLQDVRDLRCIATWDIDVVVHLAALTIARESLQKPLDYFKTNVLGTVTMLEYARRNDVNKFIFASSAAALDPKTPYGLSKLEAEQWCKLYHDLYGLNVCILRIFNVYGITQNKGVIHEFVNQVKAGRPLTVFGDGQQTRDFIHVSDVVSNIAQIIEREDHGVFEIGTGIETSIGRLAIIFSLYRKVRIDKQPARPGDVRRSFASKPYGSGFIELSEGIRTLLKQKGVSG